MAESKARQFLPIKIVLRMPQNTLKLSLIKTAGGEARQVLTIKILVECQKYFKDVLDGSCQRQSQPIVDHQNGLRIT